MATVGFAEGETSMVGLGTGMQHASIPDDSIRFEGKMKEILLIPVPQLNDDHSESHDAIKFKPIVLMGKKVYVMGVSAENASAMANIMTEEGQDDFTEMAAKEKVAEEGQDDFTEMTGDAKIDILCNVPPQVPYFNLFSFRKIGSFFRDLYGKEENYSETARFKGELKISWKHASCGLIMGADYTALASFEKTDGVLGEAAWMAASLSFLITLFVIVAPLGMPRFLVALAAILTGLSYMAFVAMKFA